MAERSERGPAPYLSHILGGAIREAQERQLLERIRKAEVPRHMAIIMDGNRRFARNAGMLIEEGHLEGKRKLEQLLDWCLEIGLKVLTVYAFSTENLRREPEEVNRLLRLFTDSFRDIAD
ncbi:MAG: undecaprenyl diphosphate synthase family protein, partial [Thermoplasmata archaeon]|nr:undecaprenyl diphosphate synthase family protein [Thermoplasmata archaeon]